MNFENWIPIIYESKTNTHKKKKKKKRKRKKKEELSLPPPLKPLSSSSTLTQPGPESMTSCVRSSTLLTRQRTFGDASTSLPHEAYAPHSNLDLELLSFSDDLSIFVEFSSASPSMADRWELQGSDLEAESRAVARARASYFSLRQCVGWHHYHQRDSSQSSSSRRSSNRFQLRFRLEFLSRFGKCFLRCFEATRNGLWWALF